MTPEPHTNTCCSQCGGPLEHEHSNVCTGCLEKILADLEEDPEVFDG